MNAAFGSHAPRRRPRPPSAFLANMSHDAHADDGDPAAETLQPVTTASERLNAVHTIAATASACALINDVLTCPRLKPGAAMVGRGLLAARDSRGHRRLLRDRAEDCGLTFQIEFHGPFPGAHPYRSDARAAGPAEPGWQCLEVHDDGRRVRHHAARQRAPPRIRRHRPESASRQQAGGSSGRLPSRQPPREFGGTGLGLSIAAAWARLGGGDVVLVESQLGGGRGFRRLPLVRTASK